MNKIQEELNDQIAYICSHQEVKKKVILQQFALKLNLKKIKSILMLRDEECERLLKCCELMRNHGWAEGLDMETNYVSNVSGPWWIYNSAISEKSGINPKTIFKVVLK